MLAATSAKKYAHAKFLLHDLLILGLFHRSARQRKLHLLVRPRPKSLKRFLLCL